MSLSISYLASIALLALCSVIPAVPLLAEPVAVRHIQGTEHGFLSIRTLEGKLIATGDMIQTARDGHMISHLVFHFKDGSLDEDTAVYTQNGHFQLLSDHHVQRGKSFPNPVDLLVQPSGQVTSKTVGEDGKQIVTHEQMNLPPDLANGLQFIAMLNIRPDVAETKIPVIAWAGKPRLVNFAIRPKGEESFLLGGTHRKAMHFVIKVELGGLLGLAAPLIGKAPEDVQVWVLGGEAPAFIRAEVQLYEGGPVWRIEQISAAFPNDSASR